MHFRQFLISALLVGAAIFFPDNAFAEKNELRPQKGQAPASIPEHAQIPQPASITEPETIAVPAKAEGAQSLNKTIPEHARENQAQAKQLPAQNTPNQTDLEKSLPEQANGNAKSVVKKAEKAVQVNVPEHAEAVQVNHTVEKVNPKNSIQDTDNEGKVEKVKPVKVDNIVYLQDEDLDKTKPESVEQEPKKNPASRDEIPKVNQALNQTQRSNSSGGQSNDRVNHGINNLSLLDKWFEWNHYFEFKLVQPYLSRQALMNTQWVNAPPSPPPQAAPLLTVSPAAKSHGS
ncbi:hypothetical protein QNH48_26995 [Neobacillus sp. YX16]|uniref:hypothetical protein n=1 Tax=Neobacillus sp. YX16 TaxID=3047874 RepID=UPI0024C2C80D|nr:hypothetical protein [Neobacillus sp. YX16]WHZ02545.1 hypothetical protein QNH48_26995 [Neobacillus sp. YX16]